MGGIVSSSHTLGPVQRDGRRYVSEDHVDNIGKHWLHEYLAVANADYNANRISWMQKLTDLLVAAEIRAALTVDENPNLIYATKAQFVPVLREAYRTSTKEESARLATWVLNRIDSGYVTENQVQNAFGLTAGQWSNLKAKMTALRTNYLAVQAASGE